MATGRPAGGWRHHVVPATRLGRWSVGSFGVGLAGLVVAVSSVASGQRGGDTMADNWWITGPALVAALGIVGAFVTGLTAVVRMHERAPTVLVVTVLGALVTLYLLAEFTTPH
jgi:uncharacterized membrane protein YeaQ/YmgE (transglycosylase-associated protein family)